MGNNQKDWNQKFNNIVKEMNGDFANLPMDELSSWEVRRATVGMNEAATYLGRFLLQQTYEPNIKLKEEVTPLVRELIHLTDALSTILSECDCIYCQMEQCPDCTDEELCSNCLRAIEDDMDGEL